MDRSVEEGRIAACLAERTGTRSEDWYLTFRARHAMLLAFRAIRAQMGEGSVVTQLLTCCTAVDPIIAAGLEPRYAEVSRCAASICPEKLSLATADRAVVLQHTYGLIDDVDSRNLVRIAHDAGIPVVEDCAHGVGRMARGADGAPCADISIHSFGVAKMLDTQFGGAVWVNPDSPFSQVAADLRARLVDLPVAGAHLTSLTRTFIFWNRVFNHLPLPVSRWLRRTLSAVGLFEPAVSDDERRGAVSHEPLRPSAEVCRRVIDALAELDDEERAHREAVEAYREAFADMPGVETFSSAMEGPVQPLLKFPILVADTALADRVISEVCAAGYYTEAWYRPYLGPGVLDEGVYRVPRDKAVVSTCMRIVDTLATLPCNVGAEGARAVAEVVRGLVSANE